MGVAIINGIGHLGIVPVKAETGYCAEIYFREHEGQAWTPANKVVIKSLLQLLCSKRHSLPDNSSSDTGDYDSEKPTLLTCNACQYCLIRVIGNQWINGVEKRKTISSSANPLSQSKV